MCRTAPRKRLRCPGSTSKRHGSGPNLPKNCPQCFVHVDFSLDLQQNMSIIISGRILPVCKKAQAFQ
ncbi:MAG TPA: hypothetical protein DCY17_03480 [Clostridiales bacterium]|nr:hypothetical protein [Clostridiales bacterium]